MRRILTLGLGIALGAGVLSACSEESPTSIGGEVIGEGFRTFDVVLEAARFLTADTTYDRPGGLSGAPFGLAARSFEDELFAHTLFRIAIPESVTYEEPDGDDVTTGDFTFTGATVTLVIDSLGDATGPIVLEVAEVTESWDPPTVSWSLRSDTSGVATPWQEPGGTTGRVLGSGVWSAADTVTIRLDSTAAAVWADSTAAARGGVIRSATPDSRLRIQSLSFAFDVRPAGADTIVAGGSASQRVVVVTPEPSAPDEAELRVGGAPTWRSALRFRSLADVEIPCEPGSTTCTIPLSDVDVSLATLLVEPLPVGARRIERPLRVEARAVLRAPGVPVTRSPLSNSFGRMESPVAPTAFTGTPTGAGAVSVPMTGYIRRNLDPPDGEDPILWIALLAEDEQAVPVFGYASFGSLRSTVPPRLRLVVTVPVVEESQ